MSDGQPHFSTDLRRRVLVVGNPYSGARHNRQKVEKLLSALREQGLEPEVVWRAAEGAARLAQLRTENDCRCVVAAGGDGTVADTINECPSVPMAVLPLGTENVFARALGFPHDAQRLARAIAAGHHRTIDLGRADGRLFGFMLSAGFDADVVHRLHRWRTNGRSLRRVTYGSYIRPLRETMSQYAYDGIVLEADGRTVQGAHAFVFNVPQYAMGLSLAPDARPDDGRLNWIVLQRPGLRGLLNYAWAVARCTHLARRDVQSGAAMRVRITSQKPVPVQVDGEAVGWTPVEVNVVPEALRVIAM